MLISEQLDEISKIFKELADNANKTFEIMFNEIQKNSKISNEAKEKVKMIEKLEKLADILDEKSEVFFEDENMCTLPNLYKLYNLWKQQEEFFDSVIRKNTK